MQISLSLSQEKVFSNFFPIKYLKKRKEKKKTNHVCLVFVCVSGIEDSHLSSQC